MTVNEDAVLRLLGTAPSPEVEDETVLRLVAHIIQEDDPCSKTRSTDSTMLSELHRRGLLAEKTSEP